MKAMYTVAAIPIAIARTVIGLALMMPIVAVCAVMDRLSATMLIKGGFDYEYVESVRRSCCLGLTAHYNDLSRFN